MNIRELLFRGNPYDGFPIRDDSQVNGWNSRHPKLAELLHQIRPKLVLEIGSWLGASALFMAENTDAHILCCDTWLGAKEMWDNQADPERYQALKIEHGHPTIYLDFMSNVIKAGKQNQITPMPMPSSIGLKLLDAWDIRPDLIYVDGSHDFQDCLQDIKLSMALRPRIICGDDFYSWPDVGRAVHSWLPDAHKEEDGFWYVDTQNRASSAAIE
jgi:hypothetical protein